MLKWKRINDSPIFHGLTAPELCVIFPVQLNVVVHYLQEQSDSGIPIARIFLSNFPLSTNFSVIVLVIL